MSLLKQLLLSITIVITCILVGTLVFSIDGARQYLNGQLQSQSENAASSLALSLSQPANQDETLRELLIMALYDSGQFQRIQFVGADGAMLFERVLPVSAAVGGAPAWFSRLLPLTTPEALREVSDGWRQVGQLSITASDAYARDALWQSSLRVLLLVVAAGVLWALFAVLLIGWFKRALKLEISDQVRAIGEGALAPPVRRRVAELASVGRVITAAHERVRATAHEQSARIESLELEVNRDPITGMANRKYFLNELRRALSAEYTMNPTGGHVLIFRQRDLAAVNLVMTRLGVDEWLTAVGHRITQTLNALPQPRPQLARLNGSDFALLMPASTGPEATRLAQRVRQDLEAMRVTIGGARLCRWAMALTDYTAECSMTTVLSRLDHGLMLAESAGHNEVEYISYGDESGTNIRISTSQVQWRTALCDALENDGLRLSVQPVAYGTARASKAVTRSEASLMMMDTEHDNTLLSGYLFMPAAVRLGLSDECDLRAIELGLRWLSRNEGELVVKVSLHSLIQAEFVQNLDHLLRDRPVHAVKLILEIDAHGLMDYGAEVQTFCDQAAEFGVRVGLRRLAQQSGALMYLHRAAIHYVKLGGDFVIDLLASPGSQQLLQAIIHTANELDITVYADDVPDEDTAALLHQSGVYTLSAQA